MKVRKNAPRLIPAATNASPDDFFSPIPLTITIYGVMPTMQLPNPATMPRKQMIIHMFSDNDDTISPMNAMIAPIQEHFGAPKVDTGKAQSAARPNSTLI